MVRKKVSEMSLDELKDFAMRLGDRLEWITFLINKREAAGEK